MTAETQPMTMAARASAFAAVYPHRAAWPTVVQEQGRDVLYATWVIGNDYRNKTQFYGAYPPGFLARVMALFPDASETRTLHVFSGALPASTTYLRCDMQQDAELKCSVYDLPEQFAAADLPKMRLVIADPPYSRQDAEKYGTPMIDRKRALASLAEVTAVGGHLAWLDTCWPMHRKTQWATVGRILVQRSTNHRVRVLTIFERVAPC